MSPRIHSSSLYVTGTEANARGIQADATSSGAPATPTRIPATSTWTHVASNLSDDTPSRRHLAGSRTHLVSNLMYATPEISTTPLPGFTTGPQKQYAIFSLAHLPPVFLIHVFNHPLFFGGFPPPHRPYRPHRCHFHFSLFVLIHPYSSYTCSPPARIFSCFIVFIVLIVVAFLRIVFRSLDTIRPSLQNGLLQNTT
jgi:hypothetical protein